MILGGGAGNQDLCLALWQDGHGLPGDHYHYHYYNQYGRHIHYTNTNANTNANTNGLPGDENHYVRHIHNTNAINVCFLDEGGGGGGIC